MLEDPSKQRSGTRKCQRMGSSLGTGSFVDAMRLSYQMMVERMKTQALECYEIVYSQVFRGSQQKDK